MHTTRLILRGIDVMFKENPIVAFLGIASIIGIAFLMMNGRTVWLMKKYKELPETWQYVVGFLICMALLSMVVLFSTLWITGSSAN